MFRKKYARRYKKKFYRKRKRSYKRYSRKIPKTLPPICKQKHKLEMEFARTDVDLNVYPSNITIPLQFAGNDVNNPLRSTGWPTAMRNRTANGVNHFYNLYTHGYCSGFKVKVILTNITEVDSGGSTEDTLYLIGMHPHLSTTNPISLITDTGRRTYRENNFYINTAVREDSEQGSNRLWGKQYISVKKFFNRNTKDDDSVQAEGMPLANDDAIFYTIPIVPMTDAMKTFSGTTTTDNMNWRINVKLTQYIEWPLS